MKKYLLMLMLLAGSVYAADDVVDTTWLASGAEDAYMRHGVSLVTSSTSDNIGKMTEDLTLGLRFLVDVAQGRTIDSSWVVFNSMGDYTTTPVTVRIYCEDADSANSFNSGDTLDFVSRVLTTAYVDWGPIESWSIDQYYRTPDIKGPVGEVITRDGWNSGSCLSVRVPNNGTTTANYYRRFKDAGSYAAYKAYLVVWSSDAVTGTVKKLLVKNKP